MKNGATFYSRQPGTKNVVNNVDKSSLRAPWQNGPYTNKHKDRHNKRALRALGRSPEEKVTVEPFTEDH